MIRDDSLCQLTGRTAIDGRVRVRRLLDGARAGVHWEACPEGPVWIDALDALTEMPLRRPARFTRIQGLEKERGREGGRGTAVPPARAPISVSFSVPNPHQQEHSLQEALTSGPSYQ